MNIFFGEGGFHDGRCAANAAHMREKQMASLFFSIVIKPRFALLCCLTLSFFPSILEQNCIQSPADT